MQLNIEDQQHIGFVELERGERMYVSLVSKNGRNYISISRANLGKDKQTGKQKLFFKNSIWIPINSTEKIVGLIGKAFKKFSGKPIPRQVSLFDVPPKKESTQEHENVTPFFDSDIWTTATQLGAVYAEMYKKFDSRQSGIMNKLTKTIGELYIHGIRDRLAVHKYFAETLGIENARRLSPIINTAYDGLKSFFEKREHDKKFRR